MKQLLFFSLVLPLALVECTGEAGTTTAIKHRSLQENGGDQLVTICVRRQDGRYTKLVTRQFRVQTIITQGGGFVGQNVPYRQGAFVFGEECQPVRRAIACSTAVRTCPGGEGVRQDPNNNCQFSPCPAPCCDADADAEPVCRWTSSVECCPDGKRACRNIFGSYWCGSSGFLRRGFGEPCPIGCPEDLLECPGGDPVRRDPNNNCNFFPCLLVDPPSPPQPTFNCERCPCGWNDGCNTCACDPINILLPPRCTRAFCPPGTTSEPSCMDCPCDTDTQVCPNGDIVSRNPDNHCDFYPCTEVCTQDVKTCADGSFVSRDASVGCAFEPCPQSCCLPENEPGRFSNPVCIERHRCCPTGEWSCSIGDGVTFPCDGVNIVSGFGEPCETTEPDACCPLEDEPGKFGNPLCFEGYRCCPTGEWSCSIGDGTTFPCGGRNIASGFGRACEAIQEEACCEANEKPGQPFLCCDDGTWAQQFSSGWALCPNRKHITRYDQGNVCANLCCDPLLEPGKFGNPRGREGHACCAVTGEWVYSIGDGRSFPCGNGLITSGFGKPCYEPEPEPCCHQSSKPGQSFLCCGDGTWARQLLSGWALCPLGNYITQYDQGTICADRCCDLGDLGVLQGSNIPIEGSICCPDGSWAGDIGNGSGTCRNGQVVSRFDGSAGVVCEPTCRACPCGYNDGCNECACVDERTSGCTSRFCATEATPFCKACPAL